MKAQIFIHGYFVGGLDLDMSSVPEETLAEIRGHEADVTVAFFDEETSRAVDVKGRAKWFDVVAQAAGREEG